MMLLAHRGNLHGPNHQTENVLSQVEAALEAGFGLETDIRRSDAGDLYISHDQRSVSEDSVADQHARIWSRHPNCEIALNVKELGYELELIDFLRRHDLLERCFLFDFELLEQVPGATAAFLHQTDPEVRLAVRVSDRYGETVERAVKSQSASVIWLDEFDSLWVTNEVVSTLKKCGWPIYAISPEIHGFTMSEAELRWKQFAGWGVDGICTDFPVRAAAILGGYA